MIYSRRALVKMGLGGLLLPKLGWAGSPTDSERCFLFVFCRGGWDTTRVFTPMIDHPYASPEEGAVEAEVNGLRFVDRESRPSVRSFFELWGDQSCVINGIEVRSVTHERCRRIMMTGSSDPTQDDWAAHLASYADAAMPCPHLVLAGPAYTYAFSDRVVRMGSAGQLADLLDGSASANSDLALEGMDPDLQVLSRSFVRAQSQGQVDLAAGLQQRAFYERHLQALDSIKTLESLDDPLQSIQPGTDCSRDLIEDAGQVFSCFEREISRCGMIEHLGWCDSGWDTHEQNSMQDWHFEDLFSELNGIMEDLQTRQAKDGRPLAERVTIVVLSEMGRHPVENSQQGKDHWTMTSAMLIGSGIAGGQVIGELDADALGQAVDLDSGETSTSGEALLPDHLGATLMALADQDPAELVDRAPISAALS